MNTERFELALERLRPSDWKLFEDLASKFLAADFQDLRTTAATSGDRGRDAFLFTPDNDSTVFLQYSVTEDWEAKLRDTAKTVRTNFPAASVLVYATNQVIGAKGDHIRTELRKRWNIHVDIRDRSWFVERCHVDRAREAAAEALAQKIVDPYLASSNVLANKALALSSGESRAAFIYLSLQWEDDTREKGLTKLSYEALVRAMLRETSPERRMPRREVHRRVREVLSSHSNTQVGHYTDLALNRLAKKAIRHYEDQDEFCLSHDERQRLTERLAAFERAGEQLDSEIRRLVEDRAKLVQITSESQKSQLAVRVRRVLEHFLFGRGEQFAGAVQSGDLSRIGPSADELRDHAIQDVARYPDTSKLGGLLVSLIVLLVEALLREPTSASQSYLRSLADAYTLLAFLRATPDVQSALTKILSDGEIWLDASIILPLFAETLVEAPSRRLTNTLQTARDLGFTFHMTEGVLEEVERHINRCIACWRTSTQNWRASVPFLYSAYAMSGRPLSDFGRWLEEFCGPTRPMDDISEYLLEVFGVRRASLEAEMLSMPLETRAAVQEIWHEAKERRRQVDHRDLDLQTEQRLVSHDVENYLGVIARRKQQASSPFGYTVWWLTLDRTAFEAREKLKQRLIGRPPDTPVLSPDFLANYIAFGPERGRVPKQIEAMLPIAVDIGRGDFMPPELLELSEKVRHESEGLPERAIRRRVREALDEAKARLGPIAQGGVAGMQRDIERSLKQAADHRLS